MARASLHFAMALDADIYAAAQVDPSLLDPLVRVDGGLPGVARPVTVLRAYQGPQGGYTEFFTVRDADGNELYTSPVRRIELRGEMFEDRFTSTVHGLRIPDAREHSVAFWVDDEELGAVPVFVESGLGGDPYDALRESVVKSLQKGTIVWVSVPQPPDQKGRPTPPVEQGVWYVLEGDKVYVLTGPTEQQVPNLVGSPEVELVVRSKDAGSQIARVPATTRIIAPDDPLFDQIGRAGLGKRLNLPDGDGALERWRRQCSLVELTPRFTPAAAAAAPAAPA